MDTSTLVLENIEYLIKKCGKIHINEVKTIEENLDFLILNCDKLLVKQMLIVEISHLMYYCNLKIQTELIRLVTILNEDTGKNMRLVQNLDDIILCEDKYIFGWLEVLEYFFNFLK